MKKLISRFSALFLAILMMTVVIPAGAISAGAKERETAEVKAITSASLADMIARAEAIVNYQWTPSSNITTWNGRSYNGYSYFPKGQVVSGMPYTLFTWELGFFSLLSLAKYKTVASINYTATAQCVSSNNQTRSGPAYGSCCATLVSEVFGGDFHTSEGEPRYHSCTQLRNSGYCNTYNAQKMSDIRVGDALSNGDPTFGASVTHIIWVGAMTSTTITIYEQTPPKAIKQVLNKASYTDSEGYFYYKGARYSVVSRINVLDIQYEDVAEGSYYLRNKATGKYLAADGTTMPINVGVAEFSADSDLQKFDLIKDSNGYVIALNSDNTLRLNPGYSSTFTSGTNINMKTVANETNLDQHWRFVRASGGTGYVIRNVNSQAMVLSVDGDNVIAEIADDGDDQVWELVSIDDPPAPEPDWVEVEVGSYYFRNKSNGKYLNASQTVTPINVSAADYADSELQKFDLVHDDNGYVIVLNCDNTLRLNPGYSTEFTSGTNINMRPAANESKYDQHWKFEQAEDGTGYIIHNVRELSMVLAVDTGTENSNVIAQTCTGEDNQVWELVDYYTVAYNANGGENAPAAQTKLAGADLTLSSDQPDREGYEFLGWAESETADEADYLAGGSYTSDASVTLYAVWKENEPEPGIMYGDVDGNGVIEAVDYLMAKRSVLGTYVLSDDEFTRTDIDASGEIEATDYLKIKRHVLGTYVIEGYEIN